MPFAPWMGGLATLIVVLTSIGAVLDLATGISLLMRKSWGRILAIVIAILSLIRIPFGTALGIYTLWVLAPSTSGAEYDAIVGPLLAASCSSFCTKHEISVLFIRVNP